MPNSIRVFVNGRGVDVPQGATALDAVRAFDAGLADGVAQGTQILTDSRGLPAAGDTPLQAGAIFRLVPRRARSTGDDAAADDQSL